MAEIKAKADADHHQHNGVIVTDFEVEKEVYLHPQTEPEVTVDTKKKRVASVDTFRGFTVSIYWIQKHIFIGVWHSRRVGILLYVIFSEILFWAFVSGILHWLGIYWKL